MKALTKVGHTRKLKKDALLSCFSPPLLLECSKHYGYPIEVKGIIYEKNSLFYSGFVLYRNVVLFRAGSADGG